MQPSTPTQAWLPLFARNQIVVGFARVDPDTLRWAKEYAWRLTPDGYVCRSDRLSDGRFQTRLLHREVLKLPVHGVPRVRFLSPDRLDVRRANLVLSARWTLQTLRRDAFLGAQLLRRAPKIALAAS
jgi:hypothetical protein